MQYIFTVIVILFKLIETNADDQTKGAPCVDAWDCLSSTEGYKLCCTDKWTLSAVQTD